MDRGLRGVTWAGRRVYGRAWADTRCVGYRGHTGAIKGISGGGGISGGLRTG